MHAPLEYSIELFRQLTLLQTVVSLPTDFYLPLLYIQPKFNIIFTVAEAQERKCMFVFIRSS